MVSFSIELSRALCAKQAAPTETELVDSPFGVITWLMSYALKNTDSISLTWWRWLIEGQTQMEVSFS
jgi:hypothetical protein